MAMNRSQEQSPRRVGWSAWLGCIPWSKNLQQGVNVFKNLRSWIVIAPFILLPVPDACSQGFEPLVSRVNISNALNFPLEDVDLGEVGPAVKFVAVSSGRGVDVSTPLANKSDELPSPVGLIVADSGAVSQPGTKTSAEIWAENLKPFQPYLCVVCFFATLRLCQIIDDVRHRLRRLAAQRPKLSDSQP